MLGTYTDFAPIKIDFVRFCAFCSRRHEPGTKLLMQITPCGKAGQQAKFVCDAECGMKFNQREQALANFTRSEKARRRSLFL